MLTIRNLVVRRGSFELRVNHLAVPRGEYLVVLGRSGAGKTTLLYTIAGFVKPVSGSIEIDGVDVTHLPPEARDIAIVPQSYALFPHMSVLSNICYGLRVRGVSKSVAEARAREIARRLGIDRVLDKKPRQLSGGEQQRVALARALAVEPKILLLDEPFTNLDPEARHEARKLVRDLHRELGFTAIHATHMFTDAVTMSTRVAYVDRGRIAYVGTAREFASTPYARRYVEEIREVARILFEA
ncbi:MAG: ATP-binding cassette domain-containing protein [Crenarchaeota archaeon]|nr:ATP-binding cassette domain-containing protein [Thermoproteota archaeon]